MRRTVGLLRLAWPRPPTPPRRAQRPATRSGTTGTFSFYDRGPYRPQVPRPDSLLGYGVGDLHTQFAWQERVLLAIANAARDRVRVEEIGTTSERRTQRLFLISVAGEHRAARRDSRRPRPAGRSAHVERRATLDALAARVPAVVWINESVHGNEAAGFETAMQTLYQLAASEEPATLNALRNIADRRSTRAPIPTATSGSRSGTTRSRCGAPRTFAMEYGEPWSIQGRYNHYRFDMNRDVMTTTQREARTLLTAAMRWHPDGHDRPARVHLQLLLPADRQADERQPRRRLPEVDGDLRARERGGVRSLRLDVLLARRVRLLRPVLLGHLAVAHRRDRHDVRDRLRLRASR